MTDDNGGGRLGRLVWLIAGAGAIAAGTALGWDAAALTAFVTPPVLLRAALVGGAVAIGIWLLTAALALLASDPVEGDERPESGNLAESRRDIGSMIRGVRLVFLAVAAFAAGAGWLLGHPLPLVVALVIAGVDVLETSFLLLVVNLRSRS
jgi:hypothetical protein